jgi:replicative DNA helicase
LTTEVNLDILLIKLFTNNSYYSKYSNYITKYLLSNYKVNNKLLYKIYRCLVALHQDNGKASVEDIYLRLLRDYPALPADEKALAQETLQKALQSICDEGELDTLVRQQYEAAKAAEVAVKAIAVSEGRGTLRELAEIFATDDLEEEKETNVFYQNDLAGLYQTTAGHGGIYWPLTTLNKTLGPLRPGDFGFLFARPETGKTTFLAHVSTEATAKAGAKVLWINNEEGGNKVLLRCYQSALGLTTADLFQNIERSQALFDQVVGDRLRLVSDPSLNAGDLERIIERERPNLIVIDQLDKVQGFDAERYDLLQKAKYQWARELAKKFECAVIGVCQAGGSAEGKKYLIMTDVDSSWTAKQGEADWILGIGKTNDEGMENIRFISICKNKLVGSPETVPEMRHAQTDIIIQPEIGRYKDRINW